jgi:SPP1 family predicted phage head-tail adaptor
MNPGKLDILGTIQTNTGSKNAAGERVDTWTTYTTVWLQKMTISGREPVAADQIVNFTMEEFKCRTIDISGVTAKMRLFIDPEIYDIIEVSYQDRMYSKLICQRRDND